MVGPVVIGSWAELDNNSDVLIAGTCSILYLCKSTMETKQEDQREAQILDDSMTK